MIEQERCIGCEACTVACQIENNAINHWIVVETQNSLKKDVPEGIFPDLTLTFLPRLCNHCEYPPCVDACPVNAIIKRNDGLVILKKDICTGCKECIQECPYSAIKFDECNSLAEKCNLCAHRIDDGLEPFCVICCEGQAIHFGDLDDKSSNISKLISMNNTFTLKTKTDTGPLVYYCPPKPRKKL